MVHIVDFCDPNDPERRWDIWIYHLNTNGTEGIYKLSKIYQQKIIVYRKIKESS